VDRITACVAGLGDGRQPHRQDVGAAQHRVVDAVGVAEWLADGAQALQPVTAEVRGRTDGEHKHRQQQRQAEAVPQRQVVVGTAGDRIGVLVQHRVQRLGPYAEQQTRPGEDGGRNQEGGCRTVHFGDPLARLGSSLACERAHQEAQAVDRREDRTAHDACQHVGRCRPERRAVQDGFEVGLLGDEAEERRQRRHARRAGDGDEEQRSAARSEPGQPADVAGAGGVVDDADDHEQRGFEHRVRAQHGQAGEHHLAAA
jgi:hypothetical protein